MDPNQEDRRNTPWSSGCANSRKSRVAHHRNVASGEERLLLSQEGNVFLSPALDKYESCKLLRYYNVKRENGKPFFGHHHEYRKDWIAANNGRRPFVRSSLPPKVFEKKLFLIGIKTVCKDSKGDLQPSAITRASIESSVLSKMERKSTECPCKPLKK